MIIYCSKCGINWARLHSEDEVDETYEFCPLCKNDLHLQPGNDIVAYMKCPVTHRIYNAETGEDYIQAPAILPAPVKTKVWDETYEEYKSRVEAIEDATPLNIQVPKTERKHHFI